MKLEIWKDLKKSTVWGSLFEESGRPISRVILEARFFARRRLVLGFVSLSFLLLLVSWSFARWKWESLRHENAQLKMSQTQLEKRLSQQGLAEGRSAETWLQKQSFLPGLGSAEESSDRLRLNRLEASIQDTRLVGSFELERGFPRDGKSDYFWHLLLHSDSQIFLEKPAFSQQEGELLVFHKGNLIKGLKNQSKIEFEKDLTGFDLKNPPKLSFLLYDSQGTLLLKKRLQLKAEKKDDGPSESADQG